MKEKTKLYVVEWQEVVTYSVEVEAPNESEARDIAQQDYGFKSEVESSYKDGFQWKELLPMHIEEVQQ